jgi:hypothetical protein
MAQDNAAYVMQSYSNNWLGIFKIVSSGNAIVGLAILQVASIVSSTPSTAAMYTAWIDLDGTYGIVFFTDYTYSHAIVINTNTLTIAGSTAQFEEMRYIGVQKLTNTSVIVTWTNNDNIVYAAVGTISGGEFTLGTATQVCTLGQSQNVMVYNSTSGVIIYTENVNTASYDANIVKSIPFTISNGLIVLGSQASALGCKVDLNMMRPALSGDPKVKYNCWDRINHQFLQLGFAKPDGIALSAGSAGQTISVAVM